MKSASRNLEKIYFHLDLNRDFRNINLYNLLISNNSGKKLLDIGCGVGHFVNLMNKSGVKAYGIEPDKKLVSLAKKLYGSKLPVRNLSAASLQKIEGKFNTITIIDVLEHIKDDDIVLKGIKKKLHKNGTMIIVVPAHPFLFGKRDKALGHFRRYSNMGLRRKVEMNGFKICELRYWNALGFAPYFISERILHKALKAKIRNKGKKNIIECLISKALFVWFKYVENNINFGFGLSIICVAQAKKS